MQFERFSIEDGLQNNIIYATTQDGKGLMWFATSTGIDRYDGTNFLHYTIPQKNSTWSNYAHVPFIFTDGKHQVWAASANSVYAYNIQSDAFELPEIPNGILQNGRILTGLYKGSKDNAILIGLNSGFAVFSPGSTKLLLPEKFGWYVRTLYQDNAGIIWVGTNKGVYRFLISNGKLNMIRQPATGLQTISNTPISGISQDNDARFWISTNDARLFIYDLLKDKLTPLELPAMKQHRYTVKDIYHDASTHLNYLAIDGGGLVVVNNLLQQQAVYVTNEDDERTLSNNAAYDVFQDSYKRLWVSTYGGGVNLIQNEVQPFVNFYHETNNSNSLSNNAAKAICEDADKNLWFGTRKGLSKYNRTTGKWQNFNEENKGGDFNADNVLTLVKNLTGNILYAGTYGGGIVSVDANSGKSSTFFSKESDSTTVGTNYVYALCVDSKLRLWAGGIRGPLSYHDPATNTFNRIKTPVYNINCLVENPDHILLAGTEKGLYQVVNDTMVPYFPAVTEKILSVYIAGDGKYWLGTLGSGVLIVSKENGIERRITTRDGLPADVICGIVRDAGGDYWVGTSRGMSHYQSKQNLFTSYTRADGLAGTQVNYGALYVDKAGEIIVGTTNGFSLFDPKNIKAHGYRPNIVFTGITINNKRILPGDEGSLLNEQIDEVQSIKLNSFQNSITIDFVNTSPAISGKHLYSWYLEGFDKTWSPLSSVPTAVYTNLSSGSYTLKVKAFSKQKQQSSMRELHFYIAAPWWRSWWALLAYFLVAMFAVYIAYNYLKIRNARRQIAERLRLNTSISHEFRTPLTLIKGPVNALANATTISDDDKANLHLAQKNIAKLESIISQFIDFQRTGAKALQMQVTEADILLLIDDVSESFKPVMQQKGISYTYTRPSGSVVTFFDRDKFEKILNNLLSNAVKYTAQGKAVSLIVDVLNTDLSIIVADTGIGIPANQQPLLFKGFFRADNTVNLKETGSGIGLSVAREMTEKHYGKLTFTSAEGKGTRFTLLLPLQNEQLRPYLIQNKIAGNDDEVERQKEKPLQPNAQRTIVVAEDNDELRLYLSQELMKAGYHVLEAPDGKKALGLVELNRTDLVITDVMMPEMNGFQLCNALKKNLVTCHIPVIMLTAIHDRHYLLEGYRSGADDYVKKPFNINYILIRVQNLLLNQTRFQTKMLSVFGQDEVLVKEDPDMLWLKQATEIIAREMADPGFSVEKLSELMATSRPVLFRKFKNITSQSPQQFIMQARLRKAVELFKSSNNNISEIAYMTGFSDPKYFSTAFKKYFGKTPREYVQSSANDTETYPA